MRVVVANPPNIDAIRKVFPLRGREIFAWGDTIYNPGGAVVSEHPVAHETVHRKQQGNDVAGWWNRYLADAQWRFSQELEAHRAEYRSFCSSEKDRNRRARFLHLLAARLSAPMYGGLVKYGDALRQIRG